MKSLKLTLLTLLLIFLSANERYIKYYIDELAFITGNNIPKSEIIRKSHIRAEYDDFDAFDDMSVNFRYLTVFVSMWVIQVGT